MATDEVILQRKFICILLFMTSPKNNVLGNVNKAFVLGGSIRAQIHLYRRKGPEKQKL